MVALSEDWFRVRKRPVEVEAAGPFDSTGKLETLEGDFEVDIEYLQEHGAYYLIRGIQGEMYPCAANVFWQTYERVEPEDVEQKKGGNDG